MDSICFMCNCCDSTTQEANLTEDLVVDGEINVWVCKYPMLSGRHSWWSGSCYNSLESKVDEYISERFCHFRHSALPC